MDPALEPQSKLDETSRDFSAKATELLSIADLATTKTHQSDRSVMYRDHGRQTTESPPKRRQRSGEAWGMLEMLCFRDRQQIVPLWITRWPEIEGTQEFVSFLKSLKKRPLRVFADSTESNDIAQSGPGLGQLARAYSFTTSPMHLDPSTQRPIEPILKTTPVAKLNHPIRKQAFRSRSLQGSPEHSVPEKIIDRFRRIVIESTEPIGNRYDPERLLPGTDHFVSGSVATAKSSRVLDSRK